MATTERSEADVQAPRRIGPGMLFLIAVAVMVLLLAGALLIGSLLSARQVRLELARIRAAGEPATADDLEAFYAIAPDERDTTELWLSAWALTGGPDSELDSQNIPSVGNDESIPPPGEAWPERETAEAFLAKYKEPLEKMHQAAELGGAARYPIKFSDGVRLALPHLQQLRRAVRLLKLESEVAAHRNDPRAAAESVCTIFAAARSLKQEPLLISQFVSIAVNGVACSQLERLLPNLAFTEEELIRFDRELAANDYDQAFRRVLLGERAIGFTAFSDPSAWGPEAKATGWNPFRKADEAAYLLLMGKYVTASQSAQPSLRDAIAQAHADAGAMLNTASARWRYPLTRLAMSSVSAVNDAIARAKALQESARTSIAIERYRRLHGETPESLGQLTPDFLDRAPIDPFDGAPLRYRREAEGYRVYSVGLDGLDQQGVQQDANGQLLDIVFEVKFPARDRADAPPAAR